MKKLVGFVLGVLMLLGVVSIGFAEESGLKEQIGVAITPTALEGDMVYSFRYQEVNGAISLKTGNFYNDWLTYKAFAIPKLEEYGVGVQVNLIEKLRGGKEVGKLLGVFTLSPGVYVAANLNDLSQIGKIQIDSGVLLTLIKIKF